MWKRHPDRWVDCYSDVFNEQPEIIQTAAKIMEYSLEDHGISTVSLPSDGSRYTEEGIAQGLLSSCDVFNPFTGEWTEELVKCPSVLVNDTAPLRCFFSPKRSCELHDATPVFLIFFHHQCFFKTIFHGFELPLLIVEYTSTYRSDIDIQWYT